MKQLTLLPPEPQTIDSFLESQLRNAGDWMSASHLMGSREKDKRAAREWASRSTKVISGQKGYLHIANAKEEDVQHFVAWMRSQAIKMMTRARDVEREFRNRQ